MNVKIKIVIALVLSTIALVGCGAKPIPNAHQTDTVYLYIDEQHEDKQAMVAIFKEEFPKKTENFTKNVIVLENKDTLPKDGLLLELSNFITKAGMTRGVWVDYTLSDAKTNLILVKKPIGSKTRWYGYNGLTKNLVKSLKRTLMYYGGESINPGHIPDWENGKCVDNCRDIARKYRM